MVKELHGDHKSLNWEQATFPFQMVQMADQWRLLTTYCTNYDDPSSPFRFAWFRTDPNPPSTEGPDCHGTLAENRGKTWKGREPHRSRHAAWNAKRGEAGLKKEAGFINGSPGAHNGLFGLALNSLEAENHRKFAEEYSVEPNLLYCVSMWIFSGELSW